MTYKADQLQPVSNLIRIPNIVSAHPSMPDQVDRRPDRLHQGQSGQADLRLLRRRAEPSPHRRLVPATDRPEDGACAVPRRRSGAAGSAGGRYPDPVRQSLSDAAAGAGRQAQRAGRDHAGAQRAGADRSDHARERAGTGEVRRLVLVRHFPAEEPRPLPSSRRSTRKSRCSWSARTSRPPWQDRRTHRLRHAAAIFRFRAGGDRRSSAPSSSRKACRWTRADAVAVIACDKREAFAQAERSDEAIHSFPLCRDNAIASLLAMAGEAYRTSQTKTPRLAPRGFRFDRRYAAQCARIASSSSATMLVILIIGLTAGPAVSL